MGPAGRAVSFVRAAGRQVAGAAAGIGGTAASVPGLLYVGPGQARLHELARAGSVDPHARVRGAASTYVAAPPATVWATVTDVAAWPDLDFGVTAMSAPDGVTPDAAFRWTNGGVEIASRFAVVDEPRELSWTGVSWGVRAIHRVLISPDGDGTRLRTEETMAFPLLGTLYPSRKLSRDLRTFLDGLKRAAEDRPGGPGRGSSSSRS